MDQRGKNHIVYTVYTVHYGNGSRIFVFHSIRDSGNNRSDNGQSRSGAFKQPQNAVYNARYVRVLERIRFGYDNLSQRDVCHFAVYRRSGGA